MKTLCSAAVAAGMLAAVLMPEMAYADGKPGDVTVKFCPVEQVRTYPLESQRGVQSLLLQNVLVSHVGAAPVEVIGVDVDLMAGGEVKDTRRIAGADLKTASATGPRLQASGALEMMAFQFCSGALIPAGAKLAGPALKQGEALLLMGQPFAYKGARDAVRVRVQFVREGRTVETSASLPINSAMSKTAFRFPMMGQWFSAVGPTPHTAHRWALPEEFAFDIVSLGDGTRSYRGSGTAFEDYHAYGADILAAADGTVVAVKADVAEDPTTLRQPGETAEAYGERMGAYQMQLVASDISLIAGNYIAIDHGNGEFSLYAHLMPGSVTVKVGDVVKAGQLMARLGSSGNSTEPHLHFQVCDGPVPLNCAGIPVNFTNIELPYADYPRPLQSGDIVLAK
jgi:murein DD-endopeptidase MepM/ murein hydrolase activator NlpD